MAVNQNRSKYYKYIPVDYDTKICECGVEFKPKSKRSIFCSRYCSGKYRKIRSIVCNKCGSIFGSRDIRRRFCDNCVSAARIDKIQNIKSVCSYCGSEYFVKQTVANQSKYCSSRCRDAVRRQNGVLYKYRRNKHYLKEIDFVSDDLNYRLILEQSAFICHICGLPIDMNIKWPNSMSASIDHVIPLSKGGKHTYENVKAAHLGCNMRKGNRYGGK